MFVNMMWMPAVVLLLLGAILPGLFGAPREGEYRYCYSHLTVIHLLFTDSDDIISFI